MKTGSENQSELVSLEGELDRIIYQSQETGFAVAVLQLKNSGKFPDQKGESVTIVGIMPDISASLDLQVRGFWTLNKKFGRQFKVAEYSSVIPAGIEGIQKYLGSGLIKGIGSVMAKRIVEKFREDVFDIIENDIDRLTEVKGISQRKLVDIKTSWEKQKGFKDLGVFLQQCDFGPSYIGRIFKLYGRDAIGIITHNPYRLASDIPGIGFKKADNAAGKLGIAKDAQERLEAGTIYTLQELANEGHVFYPYPALVEKAASMLDVPVELIKQSIGTLFIKRAIVIDEVSSLDAADSADRKKCLFLPNLFQAEVGISEMIKGLLTVRGLNFGGEDDRKVIQEVEQESLISLSEMQKQAVITGISEKLTVITGGPGTGKTTLVNFIIKLAARQGKRISLAAPTGRAAKRMSEATGKEAKTIHRLLEYSIRDGKFMRDRNHPLTVDLIILDEASMIDTLLFYFFLKAVPAGAQLIIVGDVNQLPSVGPGNILNDMIISGAPKVVELTEIFRQSKESYIIKNSHRINNGQFPILPETSDGQLTDFYLIEKEEPQEVLEIIKELYHTRIAKRFGMNMLEDIQVLSPVNKGILGTERLNQEIQSLVNPTTEKLQKGAREYRLGDKVMQIRNNYDKDVFNGDVGIITLVDDIDKKLVVDFEKRLIPYSFQEMDELVLAYAVSVHKSQGSEYHAVILPVVMSHYIMLQRNLFYTAVSRAKQLVVLVGSKQALKVAINNDKIKRRYSSLAQRI